MPNPVPSERSRWNPWPVSILSLFAVAIVAFGSFVVFCNRHPADLVATDYYDQELRFQEQMERLQRTRESAPLASASFDAARNAIVIALPIAHCQPSLTGRIDLYRPAAQDLDRRFPLTPGADGRQRIDAGQLPAGLWHVRVSWTAGQQEYFLDQKLVLGPRRNS